MPKTIIANQGEPDMSKSQNLELVVDESILDEIRFSITPKSGFLWDQVLSPQEDFAIPSMDLEKVHQEITKLLVDIDASQKALSNSAIIFLYTLEGICQASIRTRSSLFGYAD